MGLATIPVFDCDDVWLPTAEWKTLTDAMERLRGLCSQLEVASLTKFANASRNTVSEEEALEIENELGAELQGDNYYLPNGQILWSITDQWFDPADCLKTTKALIAYLESNPGFWTDEEIDSLIPEGTLEVIIALDWALEKGSKARCRFHLQCLC